MAPVIRGNSLYAITSKTGGLHWSEAEASAIALGGHLVAINSAEENQWLYDNFVRGWIGFTDKDSEGSWRWTNGDPVTYTRWHTDGSPSNTWGLEHYANNTSIGWGDSKDDGAGNIEGENRKGVAEIPLTSSITLPTAPKEGAGVFTTSINLSAGTSSSGNLANGTTVYWKVSEITDADLASGALTGSGTIANGKLDIQHSFVQDSDAGEKFEVSVFSDSGMTQQIGTKGSVGVQEATNAPATLIIRGNSLYTIVDGPSWTQAEANSVKLGGHLVTINDAGENTWIHDAYKLNPFWDRSGDIELFGGLYRESVSSPWKWSSGDPVSFTKWSNGEPSNGPAELYLMLGWSDHYSWNDTYLQPISESGRPASSFPYYSLDMYRGIAEIPLTSFITLPTTPNEGAGVFTTSINLSAGTTTNLANGTTVHWKVTGITADDLASGALTGSGTITNGKLDILHSLVQDSDIGENFEVSVFSDSGMTQQIGTKGSVGVQEATNAPATLIIRGNSLYTIVDGPSWTQAEANSVKLGGHLVAINDTAENTFIWQEFSDIQKYMVQAHGDAPGIFSHWIGLTDAEQEGTWVWTTGQAMTYVNPPFTNQEGTNRIDENYTRVCWNVPASWTGGIETKGFWQDADTQQYYNGIFYTPTGIAETPFIRRGDSAYVIVQGPTWEEAEANAVKLGGHLVTINDAAENEWLSSQSWNGGPSLYIGYSDRIKEGDWRWADGSSSDFTSWSSNEPSNGITLNLANGEDYATVISGSKNWFDISNEFQPGIHSTLFGIAEIKLAPNNAPTGTPTLSGIFKAGQVLTIDKTPIQDADNFTGYTPEFKYSWEVSSNGTTWTALTTTDAIDNNTTYTLTSAEVGKQVRGVVSYLDGYGSNETVTTTSSSAIQGGNNTPTNLTLTSSGINENSAAGTVIGTLAATDPDADSTFTYALVTGNGTNDADNALVEIVGNQVRVKSGTSIDFETNPQLNLNIQVTDNGIPALPFTKAVTVNVLDVAEGPAYNIQTVLDGSDAGEDGDGTGTYGLYQISGITGRSGAVLAVSDADLEDDASFTDADIELKPLALTASNGKALPRTWTPLAIRKDGSNLELLYKPTATANTYQTQDFSLTTGKAIGAPTPVSTSLVSFEVAYNQDLNLDTFIGSAITIDSVIDSADSGAGNDGLGSYGLYKASGINGSSTSQLVIADADLDEKITLSQSQLTLLLPLLTSKGQPLPSAWTPLALRSDGSNIELLYKPNASSNTYQTQDFSLTNGRAIGAATPVTNNLISFEVSYDQDLNNDGIIGSAVKIDSAIDASDLGEGNDGLGTYGLYRISGINGSTQSNLSVSVSDLQEGDTYSQSELTTLLPLLLSTGKALPTTWSPLAIRKDGSNIELLYKPTPAANTYQTQDFSLITGRAIGAATAVVPFLQVFETAYDQDLTGDGFIGIKMNEIGATTPILGSAAKDTLTAASLDIAYGGGGDDLLRISSDFDEFDPIIMIGGLGNDTYNIRSGAFAVVYDLGGSKDSKDTLTGLAGIRQDWSMDKVESYDYLLSHKTNGTRVLIVDPLGRETAGNRLETVKFANSPAALFSTLTQGGTSILSGTEYTYAELTQATGLDISYALGIDQESGPLSLKTDLLFNNSLIA